MAKARLLACVGLISDTHYPERLAALPTVMVEIFRGVDLVLHAGDVGKLELLDQLSAAVRGVPVVAVHGNDERFSEAQRELPYQQIISIGGHRIFLTHGHYPDIAQEMASRKSDEWAPKLDRRAAFGHGARARIVVYGHTHIPTDVEHQGVRLINPGALASGNFTTRQFRKTVALLYLRDDGTPFTVHVDLAQPDRAWVPRIDWAAGFRAAFAQTQESIMAPGMHDPWSSLRNAARALGPDVFESVRDALMAVCHRCWSGEQQHITLDDLAGGIAGAPGLSPEARTRLLAALHAFADGSAP
ncbi:MAG TPA: metallophosphoesterase family protein [Chloroflexota bacterium]|nr:metallophosphoesterase family protein [Chloroflexota bacterium]